MFMEKTHVITIMLLEYYKIQLQILPIQHIQQLFLLMLIMLELQMIHIHKLKHYLQKTQLIPKFQEVQALVTLFHPLVLKVTQLHHYQLYQLLLQTQQTLKLIETQ